MKALVEPSLTELIKPRMSLLTESKASVRKDRNTIARLTLKLEAFRRPLLLHTHDICHGLTATNGAKLVGYNVHELDTLLAFLSARFLA